MARETTDSWDIPDLDPRFNPLMTLDAPNGNRYLADGKLFIQFHVKPVMNPLASTHAGRPVYDEIDYIKIMTPGSQLTVIDAPFESGNYRQRFMKQYQAWKTDQKEVLSGTPLDSWPFLLGKVGLIAELNAIQIRTVEQLKELPDIYAGNIMGGQELKRRAQAWLEETSGVDAVMAKMAAENDDLKAQMAELQKQMAELKGKPEQPSNAVIAPMKPPGQNPFVGK